MKTAAGITALLAVIPTSFAAWNTYTTTTPEVHVEQEHQQTFPLQSGSVCRVRDSLDFLSPKERAKVTFSKRVGIAKSEFEVGPTCHITNGDEQNVPDFVGQFHKSLPHDKNGQVDHSAYQALLDCVESGDINVCDKIPSGAKNDGAKLINPLGGTGHQVDGADSDNVFIKTPSAVLSAELAAQQIEVYWMALARDIPFSEFATNEVTVAAAADLSRLPAFKGLAIPKSEGGKIDPVKDLFRTNWPGVTAGPVISQFMLANYTLDGTVVEPKLNTLIPKNDYMTSYKAWLDVQNGDSNVLTDFVEKPLFIRNGRDLSALAFVDLIYSEALRAALIMFEHGLLSSNGPYSTSERQVGFATFGEPHILTALAASSSATRHAWYTKWQVHRVLRPEAYGGLVHNTLTGRVKTPLDSSILENKDLLTRVEHHNKEQNPDGEKTLLLPMSVAEGSPVHPAYPSGHSINVGAFITTLKAFLGFEAGQRCYPNPMVSSDCGTELLHFVPRKGEYLDKCVGADGSEKSGLTYEGELNKVASNVILGRSHIGVHYRMDGVYGAMMGEAGAIRRLQQELGGLPEARNFNEGGIPPATYKFRLYSGKVIEIFGPDLYTLDGQACKGKFTGDDFCDVVKDSSYHFPKKFDDHHDLYYKEL